MLLIRIILIWIRIRRKFQLFFFNQKHDTQNYDFLVIYYLIIHIHMYINQNSDLKKSGQTDEQES